MLKAQLSKAIDNKWEACWPVSALKPLILIDCISYLLFYKKLEELGLIISHNIHPVKQKLHFVNDYDELSWKNISKLSAKELYIVFSKENGVADLLKNYGHTNLQYSQFLKSPLLVNPSSVLLENTMEIIKIIESADDAAKGEIFEYLLHKENILTSGGQVYCPKEITETLVSLIHPNGEVICDPSCGNGDLLVSVLSYFSVKDKKTTAGQLSKKLTGLDDDPVQLRIAAMNLILHGLEKPQVSNINAKVNTDLLSRKKPVLLISNLYFAGIENTHVVSSAMANSKKDIDVLNTILNYLNEGSRAAVIIRNYLLSNNISPEAKLIRQRLVDDYKIDAIINIPDKAGSFFSGSSLLIFHASANSVSDKIGFYKMKPQQSVSNAGPVEFGFTIENAPDKVNAETTFTSFFDDMSIHKKPILSEGLFVSAEEIKNNNYNLDASQYREKIFEPSLNEVAKKLISGNEILSSTSKFIHGKEKIETFFQSLNIRGIISMIVRELTGIRLKKLSTRKLRNLTIKKNYQKNFTNLKISLANFQTVKNGAAHKSKEIFTALATDLKKFTIKKTFQQETLTTVSVSIVALTFCIITLFSNSRHKNSNGRASLESDHQAGLNTAKDINTNANQKRVLTPQQIKAILKDTSGIIRVEDFTSGSDDSALDSQINAEVKK